MGCVVCVDCRGDAAVLPAGCDSVRKFSRGFYFRPEVKEEGPARRERLSVAKLTRLRLHF